MPSGEGRRMTKPTTTRKEGREYNDKGSVAEGGGMLAGTNHSEGRFLA